MTNSRSNFSQELNPVAGFSRRTIKPYKRNLKKKEHNFISYCEQFYFLNNSGFPTPEQAAVALGYSVSEINVMLQNLNVQKALEVRGLPYQSAGVQSNGRLTPTQIASAHTILNFADDRPNDQKLSELGVLPTQWNAWLNDPNFQAYCQKLGENNLKNVRPEALTEFSKLVRKGDFQALKYYFEVTGEFGNTSASASEAQVTAVLQLVVESVQRHVKDPETLAAISRDILNAAPVAAKSVTVDSSQITSEGERQVLSGGGSGRS